MFQPGEIVHAAFPFTDLTTSKRRPCLVLARSDSPDDFIVAFITSSAATPAAHSVPVGSGHPEWRRTGLKRPSLIRADKLSTLHVSVISGGIGMLPEDLMVLVRRKIVELLCPPERRDLGTRS